MDLKKRINRIMSVLITLAMSCMLVLSVGSSRIEAVMEDSYYKSNYGITYDELEYDDSANFVIDENGVLTKYNGTASIVTIPDEVTAIGEKAFYNNKYIRFVNMNGKEKSIG